MADRLSTYVALPGNTGEALEHWHEVFGGELNILRYGDAPPMEGMPFDPDPQAVAHGVLVTPGGTITGGDAMDAQRGYPIRDTVYSLLYETDAPDAARALIAKLVDGGGTVGMPFGKAPWGGWYGQVFDRFDVMWAFSCD